MEIQGPNFGIYDSRYLQVTQRERPQTVKPNVFREQQDDAAKIQQLTQDVVALSPEAQEFLRILKKHGKDSEEMKKFLQDAEIEKEIYKHKELRELVYGGEDEEEDEGDAAAGGGRRKKHKKTYSPIPNQMVLKLSSKPQSEISKGGGSYWSNTMELIDKMIVFCENEKTRRTLARELDSLGVQFVQTVKSFGTRIIVLPINMNLTQIRIKGMSVVAPGERTFDGRPWEMVRGLYDNSRRLIVIGEENIGNPRHSTAIHEFAHAFDHTFSDRNQRRLPLSVQLWNLFNKEREGLVSTYASTNPQEYFAESVEAFFRSSSKEELQRKDPQMYNYLENLFSEQD